jgi:transmembrane sensor
MTKAEFQDLLNRYRTGKCSQEEIEKVDAWFEKMEDKSLALNEFEKSHINERMISAIRQALPSKADPKRERPFRFLILKVAASLLVIMLVAYLFVEHVFVSHPKDFMSTTSPEDLVWRKNSSQEVLTVTLPDSSMVMLKPGAEVLYAKAWNHGRREVQLTGEAFFEVVKDSQRPFYVYGGMITTKVLGTSFSVNASPNAKSIEVSVRTGKVSVYEGAQQDGADQRRVEAGGVILTPNEKVEYFVGDKHWVTSLVAEPKPLPSFNKAADFVFNNTSMLEIESLIERTYAIDIVMENEMSSSSCTFTGDVSMMELYDLLDVICKSTSARYEVKGTKILITGSGCL